MVCLLACLGCGGAEPQVKPASPAPADPCGGFDAEFAKVWTPDIKQRVLDRAGAEEGIGEVIVRAVEGFRDGWIGGQTEACRARETQRISEEDYGILASCFNDTLAGISHGLEFLLSDQSGAAAGFVIAHALGPAKHLEECRQLTGEGAIDRLKARSLLESANNASDLRDAFQQAQAAFELFEKVGDDTGMADARQLSGLILFQAGDYPAALEHLTAALDLTRRRHEGDAVAVAAGGEAPVVAVAPGKEQQEQIILLLNLVGLAEKKLHRFDAALAHYREALELARTHFSGEDVQTATILDNLGSLYGEKGDFATAVKHASSALIIFRKVVGENHRDTLACQNNLGQYYESSGLVADAITTYRQIIEILERTPDGDRVMLGIVHDNLGGALKRQEKHKEALAEQTRSLEILEKALGEHPEVAMVLGNLGRTYEEMKRLEKARSYFQRSLEMYQRFFDETHPLVQGMKAAVARVSE